MQNYLKASYVTPYIDLKMLKGYVVSGNKVYPILKFTSIYTELIRTFNYYLFVTILISSSGQVASSHIYSQGPDTDTDKTRQDTLGTDLKPEDV